MLNWLFGPETYVVHALGAQPIAVRPHVLDMDTVREIGDAAVREIGRLHPDYQCSVVYAVRPGLATVPPRYVSYQELDTLSAADRARISMTIRALGPNGETDAGIEVVLRAREEGTIWGRIIDEATTDAVRKAIAQKILDTRRPRLNWYRLAPAAPYVPGIVLLASWITLEVTMRLALAAHIAGWTVIGVVWVIAVYAQAQLRKGTAHRTPGLRFLEQTRAQTQASRADRHATLKNAIIIAPISIFVTVGGLWLAGLLHLKQ
jgi:hypothetical protein